MGEQAALHSVGVYGEWIWGDDLETTVFAQAFGHDKTLIFRFKIDGPGLRNSVVARIVNCYHGLPEDGSAASFPNRASMRTALWAAVAAAWAECGDIAGVNEPDVIIDIVGYGSSASKSNTVGKINHDRRLFENYLACLMPSSRLALPYQLELVSFTSLIRQNHLGGRGATTIVHDSTRPQVKLVFKGIDFRTFLNDYEEGQISERVNTFYRSVRLVCEMPPHPNIMGPPTALVTMVHPDGDQLVCGTLHPYVLNGSLRIHIDPGDKAKKRLPLSIKARWCYQIAAAIEHTHLVAHTYHMDIKPGNFLVTRDFNLILIDWEQSDCPPTTAAPEIDGTWDVMQLKEDPSGPLIYEKYNGPERRNMPENTPGSHGWNVWNVFPIWSKQCPRALELAEVFSVGRTMWMLLRQPDMDSFEHVEKAEDIEEDWQSCEDVPRHWKQVVEACLKRSPNERMRLQEITAFWKGECKHFDSGDNG